MPSPTRSPVHFVWDGPASPFYLPGPAMRQQAEKWGIKVDATTSHQRLQPLMVARAVAEYEQRFMAVVNAAWHAACAAAKPDDQPTTEQPEQAKEAEPPTAEQPEQPEQAKEAEPPMAEQRASSQWELSAPKPPGQLNNMALAGVPAKPRCTQCNFLLNRGCCVEPDCSRFMVETAPSEAAEEAMGA